MDSIRCSRCIRGADEFRIEARKRRACKGHILHIQDLTINKIKTFVVIVPFEKDKYLFAGAVIVVDERNKERNDEY